jgi:transposase-like protein
MILFSIVNLLDEQKCYDYLVDILHPNGLHCPRCQKATEQSDIHRRDRAPLFYFRCSCGRVYNAFSGTVWQGTHHRCSEVVRILQGIAQGTPTLHLAKELEMDRKHLLERRHKIQAVAAQVCTREPLSDEVVETDEMYQNAGEKGKLHPNLEDPPRRRGNKVRGHGTWDNDRLPVVGTVGRESGQVHIEVKKNSGRQDLEPHVVTATREGVTVNTDEWGAYRRLPAARRLHKTVCHGKHEWARDDDGDGIREVHVNTIEGLWTGLRNFLRLFRGVNKEYLQQYIAIHEWAHNLKKATIEFLRILCGVTRFAS